MALVPFRYTFRSLFVRRSATLLTVFSIAATVAVIAGVLALQQGFASMSVERGRPDIAVILRQGAKSEGESGFPRDRVDTIIKGSPEIALDEQGQPLAAAELYLAVRRRKMDGGETNVPIRGVQRMTFAIHGDDIEIVEGESLTFGRDEVIVAESLTDRIRNCELGSTLVINTTPFRVVGVFRAKGSYGTEIWGDVERMMEALERPVFSRVIARTHSEEDLAALTARLEDSKQVPAKVQSERDYLQSQTGALTGVFLGLGALLGIIMGLAAVFTGTNSMLSALSSRTQEIGILLSIGFRGPAIFFAFLLEAVFLGLMGGLVGCLLVLPLNGIQTGTTNFDTFTEVTFGIRTTPFVLVTAVLFAMLLGLIGGALPAWRAARLRPVEALRRA